MYDIMNLHIIDAVDNVLQTSFNCSLLQVLKLIGNLKTAFKEMLKYNDWMDEETKEAAKAKVNNSPYT